MTVTRVAAIQMVSNFDVEANLRSAEGLLQHAAEHGAELAVLPENFAVLDSDNLFRWGEEERRTQLFTGFLAEQAKRHGMQIIGGTVPLRTRLDGSDVSGQRVTASSLAFSAEGVLLVRYDKLHLFDVAVGDAQGEYRESRVIEPGQRVVSCDSVAGKLGLSVCYDVRFPELYQQLRAQGCELFTVPSAFTYRTGEAHWRTLMQARAIENQAFVIAPNQGGQHSATRQTWGHSLIVDPWGAVLAEMEQGPGVILADLDRAWQQEVRAAMPIQSHKRFQPTELT